MANLNLVKQQIKDKSSKKKAELYQRYFKTGKGDYGEGDIFMGLTMGENRIIAKKNIDLSLIDTQKLLRSKIHEHRMVALLILLLKFRKANLVEQKKIYKIYLKNYNYINNWDLVDVTCPYIVGGYLSDKKDRKILYQFAKSNHLWKKRIAIISCMAFIRKGDYRDGIKISKILLKDEHDLIHKAVGWMLREVGKKDLKTETDFLDKYYKTMSRTTLRYAIEKFPETKRKYYLNKK